MFATPGFAGQRVLVSPDNKVSAQLVRFHDLARWNFDQHQKALVAFIRSCGKLAKGSQTKRRSGFMGRYRDWAAVCAKARKIPINKAAAQRYFEKNFIVARILAKGDRGLFTGYFEPTYRASLKPSRNYTAPLYLRPKNVKAYSRAQIENGALRNTGLDFVYLANPVDAFFLHIQGSGRLTLESGGTLRVGFAAKNGHAYTAIGKYLIQQNHISRKNMSMQSIRRWLEDNPQSGKRLMQKNASFIFFRPLKNLDPHLGPIGAQGIPLTPQRSLAIDRKIHGLGMPMWLETELGNGKQFHQLMVAQDTGSAIKGAIRGDIFWGSGTQAGKVAGNLKQRGKLYILLPKTLAAKFGAKTNGQ